MYPNALQISSINLRAMDNATLLSFLLLIDGHGQADATMRERIGEFFTDFHNACTKYDEVFNPTRRSLETEDLKELDDARDGALGAYHEALLGLQRHPVEAKRQAARLLLLNYETYGPDRKQEYMKETELISQMTTEIRATQALSAAVELIYMDDYLTDLEQKNQAFREMMATRTASTEGVVKGAVAEARAAAEAKYQLFRQMLNVASIYEGDTDYRAFILKANAEIEHYRQILARKGVSTGSSSNNNGGSSTPDPNTGGDTPDPNTGGDTPDPNTGGDTPDPNTGGDTPDPNTGGDTPGGGDNPGGGGGNGGGGVDTE